MRALNVLGASEIGDRARHLERSMIAARGEIELCDRSLQRFHAISIKTAMLFDLARRKHRIRLPLSCKHAITRRLDSNADVIG